MKRLIFLVGVVVATHAQAQQNRVTAGDTYFACTHAIQTTTSQDKALVTEAETDCKTFFLGFTQGLFVGQMLGTSPNKYCLPKDSSIDADDARKLFVKFMEAHPEATGQAPGVVAGTALAHAYQCSN
ncbi:MAG: Rap1a/Tai family immunity protein [Rhizomicrobium sp.]|jgi:hypothetical protein